jgi:hypothetical protein
MTILESHRILIGTCGWLHDNWQESFYPEDLPSDWYLGYYGNEFPVVLVGEKEWQQAGSAEEWLEETDDLPMFICEIPLQDPGNDVLQQADSYLKAASQMGDRCLGIVCRVNHSISAAELKSLLQACQAIAPTVLAMDEPPSQVQAIMNELQVNPLWTSAEANKDHGGSLYIACLDSSKLKLPELRASMENLLARQSGQTTLVLLIGGQAPDIETIKQAKVMLDLI